jgi:hypothetical protein
MNHLRGDIALSVPALLPCAVLGLGAMTIALATSVSTSGLFAEGLAIAALAAVVLARTIAW